MKRLTAPFAIIFTVLLALIVTIALSRPVVADGINGNPWGYSFSASGGKLITQPNAAFCTSGYFHCISSFSKGKGYVVECQDGLYSKSGGKSGSCSKHGGDLQTLYAHTSSSTGSSSPPVTTSQPVTSGNPTTSPALPYTGSDPTAK